MNKLKATRKNVKDNNYRILGAGYCSMQSLLHFKDPLAYSAGVNGWQCDYYDVNNVIISTGYSPLNNKNITCDYKTIKVYEDAAHAFLYDHTISWDQKRDAVNALLHQLLDQVKYDQSI